MTYGDAIDISYSLDIATTEEVLAALHIISGEPRTQRNVCAMHALMDDRYYRGRH